MSYILHKNNKKKKWKKKQEWKKKTTLQKVFISAMSWSKQVATVSILVK